MLRHSTAVGGLFGAVALGLIDLFAKLFPRRCQIVEALARLGIGLLRLREQHLLMPDQQRAEIAMLVGDLRQRIDSKRWRPS